MLQAGSYILIAMYNYGLIQLFFARGGGGGSGGGGGGGGGGIIVIIGYMPTHFVGGIARRKIIGTAGLIITSILTVVYAGLWFWFGKGNFLSIIIGLLALLGGPAGYFGWWGKLGGLVKRSKRATATALVAAEADPGWDLVALETRLRDVFERYQADWSQYNTENMRAYTTPTSWHFNYLMLLAMQQRERQNIVVNPRIMDLMLIEAVDKNGVHGDTVTYYIQAKADDQLVDTNTQQTLYVDDNTFEEYWTFVRDDKGWMLDKIEQVTADDSKRDYQVLALANSDPAYHYSLDWGWLLLPQRGQLFKNGTFGVSDINNHIIGVYHDVLIELYTYIPDPKITKHPYIIAQAALPKRYGSLIVKAKSNFSMFDVTPAGYNKLRLEWPDFNKRYTIYATNAEQVTVFELMHPVYMEKLFDLPFKVSIEVVDNIVYLYSSDANANYETMLSLLKDAFEEMKL